MDGPLGVFEDLNFKILLVNINSFSKGPSINDVSPNLRFLGYPCLLKSTSKRLLFGHFLYPPPSLFGETSFMDGP